MPGMEHMHQGASFSAMWSPGILLLTILLGWLYFYLVGAGRHRFQDSSPVGARKKTYMVLALVTLYIGQGSPLNYYGHADLFSAHMMQQSLLYLVMPPLVLLAIPEWLLKPLLDKPFVKKWIYPLFHPLLTVLVFNMLFSMYHIPTIFEYSMSHPSLHVAYHLVLLVTAFHMWFPVFCPVAGWQRISDLQKLAYLVADGILLTPACACIIFANSVIYGTYADEFTSYLPPLDDQQLGGTIMKIVQEIVYGAALAYVFFKWYRKERKKDREEEELSDAELLQRTNLSTHT
ncbi:cytochrome c oxidase assembly protein [Paenibacillus aurantius]|uniref:Cytochrome c oxidase assembly protein n=1 Tax=Paenibacillus aurantius TaxID=2918900 RepID=A0AA96RI60_9BACL|nr:cytochrome c oxidase assembly protein [Paenibacillus aurantius]WJH36513.1 cytochrome c oxidase assembly protein [Paenibacillus sp. CC-CFT747]WNQ11849.1 cytochrome c oxidase assembly protein [Paenibacillus aurantius]